MSVSRRQHRPGLPDELAAKARRCEGKLRRERPGKAQLRAIRKAERQFGLKPLWVRNAAEARVYRRHLSRERTRLAAEQERKRHPDQWGLPAASVQKFQLRQRGIEFDPELTRREAHDLLEGSQP